MKPRAIEVTIRPRIVQIEPLHRAFCCQCGRHFDGYASAVKAWADGHACTSPPGLSAPQGAAAHREAVPEREGHEQ